MNVPSVCKNAVGMQCDRVLAMPCVQLRCTRARPHVEPFIVAFFNKLYLEAGSKHRQLLESEEYSEECCDDCGASMLRCAERGDHDAVVEGEAVAHLRRLPADSVDVIVAADVLAYIGDCAELFGEAQRVLRINGRLVFTLEEGDAGFGLGPGGRFVHSEAYLYEAAAAAGLRVAAASADSRGMTSAGECMHKHGKGRRKCFSFTGSHFGNMTAAHRMSSQKLDIVVLHI